MTQLKIAMYWAAGCGGCDVSVLDLHDRILKVAEAAQILFWPIALDTKYQEVERYPDGHIDVCFFNGAVRNSENLHLAQVLRRTSKVLIAYGSCAHLGGIPGLANFYSKDDVLQQAYVDTISTDNPDKTLPQVKTSTRSGELTLPTLFNTVQPLDRVVPVDYYLPGCPPAVDQVWGAIQAIVRGALPPKGAVVGASEVALCDECKRQKSEKRIRGFKSIATFAPDPDRCMLEQGVVCCGPATRAGCGSQCLNANMPCRGCYGPPPGVIDQGAKLLSSIASVIDSDDPEEIGRIVKTLDDPAGTFYRFSLPASLLAGSHQKAAS